MIDKTYTDIPVSFYGNNIPRSQREVYLLNSDDGVMEVRGNCCSIPIVLRDTDETVATKQLEALNKYALDNQLLVKSIDSCCENNMQAWVITCEEILDESN